MSKRKLKLEEAKEILQTDKVFYNGNDKFNVLDVGKYNSGMTIEIPQKWTINKDNNPESPIHYIESKELTNGMNIDFDGSASILLGKYRLSRNGKPVFELTAPTDAKDALIEVSWGGAFNTTRGQSKEYAQEIGAEFFTRRMSSGRKMGSDFWVLPVGFVKDREERDVSSILADIQEKEENRVAEIDAYLKKKEEEIQESINNRDEILQQVQPIIEQIKLYDSEFSYKPEEIDFIYKSKEKCEKKSRYTNSLVDDLNEILEKKIEQNNARNEFVPQYKELEGILSILGIEIRYCDEEIRIEFPNSSFESWYRYSSDGYNSCVNDITEYKEKIKREKEEARIKVEELKRAMELEKLKEEAKSKGYPETFEFCNRLYGATGLSHAYVIEQDGTIREPDYNNLNNQNHKHRYADWKNMADGRQGYNQILPGEIIISYQKRITATPYVFNIEWADENATEEQLGIIQELLNDKVSFSEDIDGNQIISIEDWFKKSIEEKIKECRTQLKLQEDKVKSDAENTYATSEIAEEINPRKGEVEEVITETAELAKQEEIEKEEKSGQTQVDE